MRVIALDVETTKLPLIHPWQDSAYLVMVSIVDFHGHKRSWIFNHDEYANPDHAKSISEIQEYINLTNRMVGQNIKFDLNWLRSIGIDFSNTKLYCTKIADYLINGSAKIGYSLNSIAERRGISLKHDEVKMYWESGYETSQIPLKILIPYCEHDCEIAMAIYKQQVSELKSMNLVRPATLAFNLTGLLSEIEYNGMFADELLGKVLVSDIQQQLDTIDIGLKELMGDINLNSGNELSAALFGGVLKRDGTETVHKKLKSGKTRTYTRKCVNEIKLNGAGFSTEYTSPCKKEGYYFTNKNVLEQLKCRTKKQKDIKNGLLTRSAVAQSLESLWGENDTGIINKIQADRCIHPQYNQTVTVTGRLSSKDPNGQNLPREGTSQIKRIIIPRFDKIVAADLSQLEWRVGALLSNDEVMIQEILDGADVHSANAINFFGDIEYRKVAKFFTFRLLYGGSAYGFYMDHKMPRFPIKKWESIVNNFYEKYSGLQRWQTENIKHVVRHGTMTIPSGRFFKFRKINGQYSPRHVKNYPVQGFSFDIMALAMLIIRKKMGNYKTMMIGQVHDEVVFDCVKSEFNDIARICIKVFENIPQYMEEYWGLKSPVPFTGTIEVGNNYEEMAEVNRNIFLN